MHLVDEQNSDEAFALASDANVMILANAQMHIFRPTTEIQVENTRRMDYAAPSTFNSM